MTSQQRVFGSFVKGFSILRLPRSIAQTLVPVLGFVALANLGCTSSIAAQYPHLDRREVCLLPGTEPDATEIIFTKDNVPVSNLHPEIVDQVAPTARTIYLLDPNVDPSSVRYLPAPYNQLQCPARFSILPSGEPQTSPLPEASFALVLHEQRPEVVPRAVTEKLANCVSQGGGQLKPIAHTMTFHAYLTNKGRTASAYIAQSTLGDRKIEACMVAVLRTTSWPVAEPATVAVAPQARLFFGQPAPVVPVPDVGDRPSGIYPKQSPQGEPGGGFKMPPRIFVIPLHPVLAAVAVFGIIYFWLETDTPAWVSELNPITREPYTSLQEYEDMHRLSQQEIDRQREQITNSQSQPPPASTPTPAPAPPPAPTLTLEQQREQEKKRERCAKIVNKIDEIINKERPATPPGGKPQGRKGIKWRWREIAENIGKWGPQPDGSPSKQMKGHLEAYRAEQLELTKALDDWKEKGCNDKDHGLPHNARQYAAQKPEYGPGKPLEPAPTPEYYPPVIAPAIVSPPKKASK